MDAVILARIQFAVTIGFHYIFPVITLGLALLIVIFLGINLKQQDKFYDTLSQFWIRIFTLNFAMGVVTGIVMEFQFGTNWEKYSRFVGDIFGAPLAAEGIFSFFLESTFLGVLIFGKKRVSSKFYFFSALMVFIGSTGSAFWIIAANSWQQTPAGYHIINGRAELTDFFAAIFNASTLIRFSHAVVGGWITGSFFVAGISAHYLLKKQHLKFAKKSMVIALTVGLLSSLLQAELGHIHAIQVAKTQPDKLAAVEAIFETQKNAPMVILGFPDVENQTIDMEISIPGLLSWLIDFDTQYEVKGLNSIPEEDRPPVLLPFYSYRIMVGLGFFFILLSGIGIFLYRRDTLAQNPLFLKVLLWTIPLPIIANEFGWVVAEVGRQPWIVYKVLRTSDAISSVVSAGEILFSLILFSALYVVIFSLFIFLLKKKIKIGPVPSAEKSY
jgi:cytochrome bd ubiquinol oxidase subunit I